MIKCVVTIIEIKKGPGNFTYFQVPSIHISIPSNELLLPTSDH